MDAIQSLKITWDRSYTTTVKVGEIIQLFEDKGIFEDLVAAYWPDGATKDGKTYAKRCLRVAKEYRQFQGSGQTRSQAEAINIDIPVVDEEAEVKPLFDSNEGKDIQQQLLQRLQLLTPRQFERVVGEFLKAKGLSEVKVTGGSGDGGIDGECALPFLRLKVAFQAKRYAKVNTVGANPIRNFKGGLVGRFDRGIFITTSTFTAGAMEEADEPGITLVLIDGEQLVKEMIDLGLGIKSITVEAQIDGGFFEGLGTYTKRQNLPLILSLSKEMSGKDKFVNGSLFVHFEMCRRFLLHRTHRQSRGQDSSAQERGNIGLHSVSKTSGIGLL